MYSAVENAKKNYARLGASRMPRMVFRVTPHGCKELDPDDGLTLFISVNLRA